MTFSTTRFPITTEIQYAKVVSNDAIFYTSNEQLRDSVEEIRRHSSFQEAFHFSVGVSWL